MNQGPQQVWSQGQMPVPPPPGPPPGSRPPSTAMLTVTWVLGSIAGLAYIGLFVLMGITAADEITTIERIKDLKESGAQVTNTDEDLADSIAENELAIVVFFAGAAITIPLVVASILGRSGRNWTRTLATVSLLPPIVVIIYTVIHDIQDGHPENSFALVFTIPAIVLGIFWWLPPTSRAMATRRWRRMPVHQGPPPMPGWQGQPANYPQNR